MDHKADFGIKQYSFLAGTGEMATLTRKKDWSSTMLGSPDRWSQSLRTSVQIVLQSKFPMLLFWGKELICFYNDAFRPSLGKSGKHPQMLGMDAATAWAEIWNIIQPMLDQVMSGGESIWMEDAPIPLYRNGRLENANWTFGYSLVNDDDGHAGGILVVCTETTEKVLGLNAAFNNEKKFRNTVTQAPVGILILRGPDFITEVANENYLALVAREESEFVGKPLFETLPEVREIVEPLLTNVFETGEAFYGTEFPVFLIRHGKKEQTYFNFIYKALREDNGEISGIIVVANEVTSLVEAKQSLIKSEKRFRDMVMQSPIPMTIFRGSDFIIEMANNEMLQNIWHKEADEVFGKKALEVFPELNNQKFPELLATVLQTGKSYREKESLVFVQGNEGLKKFYLDYEYAPLFEIDGSINGVMITVNDVTEKVNTRERIEESEERLSMAIESTRLGTWDYNLITGQLSWSQECKNIYDLPDDVVIDFELFSKLIYPDDIQFAQQEIEKSLDPSGNGDYDITYRILRYTDRAIRWIRSQGQVYFSPDKKAERFIGTVVDITEQKLAENEIARMAAIVQSSDDAIISKTLNGIVTSWNTASERMFGYTADEMIGQAITKIIPSDRINEEGEILARIAKGERINHFETKRLTKDNRELDISLTVSPIKDKEGRILGASKISRDVTDQKKAERALQESETRFRQLANSMPQLVWTSDANGGMNYFNQSVYDFSGLDEKAMMTGWLDLIHTEDLAEYVMTWKRSIESGESFLFEHRFKNRDAEFRWQLSRAVPLKDEYGKIQLWVGTSTDIHKMKETEQQKDFFISMASHELKTPITSIKGYVQILQSIYGEGEDQLLKNSLRTVDKQIVTLTTLIADLLDLSKIKSGSLQLDKKYFSVDEMILEVVEEVEHTQPDYEIIYSSGNESMIFADQGRIAQVLINFLTNAIKYSPYSKSVSIHKTITDGFVTVSVQDTGIGISKADQAKIFQRFYRVEGQDEKTFPGFGIGLFIASEIVQRHEGKIWVESETGKGSKFYFSLPLNKKESE